MPTKPSSNMSEVIKEAIIDYAKENERLQQEKIRIVGTRCGGLKKETLDALPKIEVEIASDGRNLIIKNAGWDLREGLVRKLMEKRYIRTEQGESCVLVVGRSGKNVVMGYPDSHPSGDISKFAIDFLAAAKNELHEQIYPNF